jgi:NADPH:quinone reductase
MPRAVRFDEYGGVDVLQVLDIEIPDPARGEVQVAVKAAGVNPSEGAIRSGAVRAIFPATFPSGEGSDLAGVVRAVGKGVDDFLLNDEVLGWSAERSSHAELVNVPAGQLIPKPPALSWEVAGGLYVVGVTALGAARSVDAGPLHTVVVSAAAGGVGAILCQLLQIRGAEVIGIASDSNCGWLESKGVIHVAYGDGLADRIRAAAPGGIDAFIDLFGPEYLELAVELGVPTERIDTIASHQKALEIGAKTEGGGEATSPGNLAIIAELVAGGRIEVPIAATFPLDRVREAYEEVERRHSRGKVVLVP